jgi:hypothetical protein
MHLSHVNTIVRFLDYFICNSLQENRVHSSVPRNITGLYYLVSKLRNIVSTDKHSRFHRLSDECTGWQPTNMLFHTATLNFPPRAHHFVSNSFCRRCPTQPLTGATSSAHIGATSDLRPPRSHGCPTNAGPCPRAGCRSVCSSAPAPACAPEQAHHHEALLSRSPGRDAGTPTFDGHRPTPGKVLFFKFESNLSEIWMKIDYDIVILDEIQVC